MNCITCGQTLDALEKCPTHGILEADEKVSTPKTAKTAKTAKASTDGTEIEAPTDPTDPEDQPEEKLSLPECKKILKEKGVPAGIYTGAKVADLRVLVNLIP